MKWKTYSKQQKTYQYEQKGKGSFASRYIKISVIYSQFEIQSKIFLKITRLNTNLQINVNLEIDVDFDMKGNYHSKDGELKSELKENFIVCIHCYIIE